MNKINIIKKEDAIYIAGLFDGEGCISLSKSTYLRSRCKTSTYILRARIRMTDIEIVKWLHKTIGGRFYGLRKVKITHHKPYAEWGVAGKNTVEFLSQIYPYLKVKKLQTQVAFEYGKTLKVGTLHRQQLSSNIVLIREELRNKMLKLNKRGITIL